jgi:5-methylcytosine-specific restriction endonuclease McrA
MIDVFRRYQKGLTLNFLFPQKDKSLCACGCNKPLRGRKTRWASKHCQNLAVATFYIVKGDISFIRKELFKRDKGICSNCGKKSSDWDADHILPVYLGGGGCELDNFQTLCKRCHGFKNRLHQTESHHRAISSHAEDI